MLAQSSTLDLTNQTPSKKNEYKFKPVRFIQLRDIYQYIEKIQIEQSQESMFPINFVQLHQKTLKNYVFQLEVSDLYKSWTIIKSMTELMELKQSLKTKFPESPLIFQFPETQESQIEFIYAHSMLQLFTTFLRSVSKSEEITKQKEFLLFIENWVSSQKKRMVTYFQRNLIKKAGGRHTESSLSRIMNNFISWRHKFFTITNEGLYYTDEEDSFNIKEMLLFNESFFLSHGEIKTGYTYGLILNSSHRILQVDAQKVHNFLLFIYFVRKINISKQGSKINRFNSFAQVRVQSCESTFYIDGKDYFKAMYQDLKKAKNEVFITGWIVTPHMYLVQKFDDLQYRIDKVLQGLAKRGVKIYIIVYNAPRIAIDINPEFTENYLTSLHSNIKVLRHPHYVFIPFLWSHHEKMVIIDQKCAFMGGLDIGYGRMDDNQHKLSDELGKVWKGIEYCNYRVKDLCQIHEYQTCSIDRQTQPRMPWHDVAIKLSGSSVIDLCKHFVQYWNYANYQSYLTERELLMFTGIHEEELESFEQFESQIQDESHDKKLNPNTDLNQKPIEQPLLNKEVLKPVYVQCQSSLKQDYPMQGQIVLTKEILLKQNTQKEMFSKSIHSQKHRNHEHSKYMSFIENRPHRMYEDSPELKKLRSNNQIQQSLEHPKEAEIQYYLKFLKSKGPVSEIFTIESPDHRVSEDLKPKQIDETIVLKEQQISGVTSGHTSQSIKYKHSHQVLRSASLWSLGLEEGKQQKSILQAYLSMIQNSKHFIYIQNQFFISLENRVSQKIVERILRAAQNKQNFKVLIVIPFLPGFNGQIEDSASAVFRVQVDLMYKTICRGQNSMLSQLSVVGNLEDYLAIYCLRTHGLLNGMPVTQIVYVHSKVMIVDDQTALIGSANINDRSLMGDRDSELAIIVEDSEEIEVKNDILCLPTLKVKKFAHQLRKQLYMEHFAISKEEAEHPLNFNVWDKITFNAERNQKIYRKLFGCYPDDGIKCFSDIPKYRQEAQPQRYDELKILIKGFACPFQSEFLCNDNLQLHSGQKEYYIPFINFT